MRKPLALSAAVVVALAAAVAAASWVAARDGGADERALLDSVADSLATTPLPSAGLGEGSPPAAAELRAGWDTDFTRHSVPFDEIRSGGPPKDGIPSIDAPQFVPAAEAGFLRDPEPVIELELGGEVRAYPIQILIWHEIVNDTIGGRPVAVTFCPLCNTAIVFDRRLDERVLDFGTTGNLRNSDLVMYDRQTESWWQQFSGEAIVGELTGRELRQVAARIVSWREFRAAHPDGKVLTRRTGHQRSYGENPYAGYDDVSSPPFFAAANADDARLPPKERVVYLERGEDAAAVPYSVLRKRRIVTVELGGRTLVVRWRPGVASSLDDSSIARGADVGAATVTEDGAPVSFHEPFWFAVAAFRPDVRVVR
jgi:hypothetical protein